MSQAFNRIALVLSRLQISRKFPTFEQDIHSNRIPQNPKIAIYGPYNFLFNHLINRVFANYNKIELSSDFIAIEETEKTTDNSNIKFIGNQLLSLTPELNYGHIIQDFPQNAEQAERLDRVIDGFNLVVNIKLDAETHSDLPYKYLQCLTCKHIFNLDLKSTSPELPGQSTICQTPTNCNINPINDNFGSGIAEYNKKFGGVLNYYEERGCLLNFEVNPNQTIEEVLESLRHEVEANIKF